MVVVEDSGICCGVDAIYMGLRCCHKAMMDLLGMFSRWRKSAEGMSCGIGGSGIDVLALEAARAYFDVSSGIRLFGEQ
jgi:hypothetical protein